MVFSSPIFLFFFFPLFFILYKVLPAKGRTYWLLLASLIFYAWGEPAFVLIMLAEILLIYLLGLAIRQLNQKARHKAASLCCAAGVLGILGLLVYFKYANFLADIYRSISGARFRWSRIALPIGISFFSFQALSYLWDVKRGRIEAQRNPFFLGAYIAMFPQLIAGPIVRYEDVCRQLAQPTSTLMDVWQGLMRFITGLGKKVLLANSLAVITGDIFQMGGQYVSAATVWLGAAAFALQIYYDFSGYSDMAIGLGRMMGFHFNENFRYPYTALSVKDFWRRWHISLSSWFRDYVYIPLGGSRKGRLRTALNLMTVFVLCGLWHGASWNYLIWGIYYGLFLALERFAWVEKLQKKIPSPIRWALTLVIVLVGWVLFQECTPAETWSYLAVMFGAPSAPVYEATYLITPKLLVTFGAGFIGIFPILPFIRKKLGGLPRRWQPALMAVESLLLIGVLLLCSMLLMGGTYNPFIYFRF